jgi:hypothetical protein
MDIGSILVIVFLVFAVPLGLAWVQSRWEIASERRRAARLSSRASPIAVPDSDDQATSVLEGVDGAANATDASPPDSRVATSRVGLPVDDPWKFG